MNEDQRGDAFPRDWKPLLDALDFATSALGIDSWELMKGWTRSGQLPMQGRADGITQDIQRHWFDFLAQWGCDDPLAGGEPVPPVGPGTSSDRPRRTTLQLDDPKDGPPIDRTKLKTPPRLASPDDILYFDVPREKIIRGLKVPNRVTDVLVEMNALRRLVYRQWENDPANKDEAEFWFEVPFRKPKLEAMRVQVQNVHAPDAVALAVRNAMLFHIDEAIDAIPKDEEEVRSAPPAELKATIERVRSRWKEQDKHAAGLGLDVFSRVPAGVTPESACTDVHPAPSGATVAAQRTDLKAATLIHGGQTECGDDTRLVSRDQGTPIVTPRTTTQDVEAVTPESWTYYQAIAYLAYGSKKIAARYGGHDNREDGGAAQRLQDELCPLASGLPGFEIPRAPTAGMDPRLKADADRWLKAARRLYQALLKGSVIAYRQRHEIGEHGLIDPVPADEWKPSVTAAAKCHFVPSEVVALEFGAQGRGQSIAMPSADGLRAWHSTWAEEHPLASDDEAVRAARGEFGDRVTERDVIALRKPEDGSQRKRGPKVGKTYAGRN